MLCQPKKKKTCFDCLVPWNRDFSETIIIVKISYGYNPRAKTSVLAAVAKDSCYMFKEACWLIKSAIYEFPTGSKPTDRQWNVSTQVHKAKKGWKKGTGNIHRNRGWEIRGQGAVGYKHPCLATCTYYCRACYAAVCVGYATLVQSQKTRQGAPHSLNRRNSWTFPTPKWLRSI